MGLTQNLRPWQRGISGNPGGRPKYKRFEKALRKAATQDKLADIANAAIEKARQGDIRAAEFVADHLDGKLPSPGTEPPQRELPGVILSRPRDADDRVSEPRSGNA